MAKIYAQHQKPKVKSSIFGRIVHDVPNSFLNRAKPSDKPTKVLYSEGIETPVISDDQNPGTTVLGMGFEDDSFANEESVVDATTVIDESFDDENKVEEIEEEPKPKPKTKATSKSTQKTKTEAKHKAKSKVEAKPKISGKPKSKSKVATKSKATSKVSSGTKTTKSSKPRTPRYAKFVLVRKLDDEVIKISKKDFVIGKSKYSDYQVTKNNTVSRSHVVAHKHADGSLTVEDNDSKNGTFLDGERLEAHQEVVLSGGMSLRLSDEIFVVREA